MNFTLNERTKHRLTGLVVLIAVAIIFLPAMLKKSNLRLEENVRLSVQLPPKPEPPKVAITQAPEIFETVKVEKVMLPKPLKSQKASQIARIESLQEKPKIQSAPPKKQTQPILITAKKEVALPKVQNTKPPNSSTKTSISTEPDTYAVQLASFSVLKNAEKLVNQLNNQGYKAIYREISSNDGPMYKVTVGQLDDKQDAVRLKKKLFDSTQINGFIVKREVG